MLRKQKEGNVLRSFITTIDACIDSCPEAARQMLEELAGGAYMGMPYRAKKPQIE